MIPVVDASVAVKWFVEEEGRADALAVLRCDADIVVPDLFFAEFANCSGKRAVKARWAYNKQRKRSLARTDSLDR